MPSDFKPPSYRLNRYQKDIVEGPQREPSAVPRQIRDALRQSTGAKRWVSRGEYLNAAGERPDFPSSFAVGDDQNLVVVDPRTDSPPQWPLSKNALKLLEMYLQREAFLWAIEEYRYPVDLAGKMHLQLGKARSYAILRELEQHRRADSEPAWNWLRAEAKNGFEGGAICPGRETIRSAEADSFFLALAGGVDYIRRLREEIREKSYSGPTDMRQLTRSRNRVDREVLDYTVWNNLHHRAG